MERHGMLATHHTHLHPSRYLWFITLSYCMVMVFSNWFVPRLITLHGITTDAGTLIFPLSFLLSDLITEVYGYKHARMAIWCAFLFNTLFLLYGQLIIHLPSPSFAANNPLFDQLLKTDLLVVVASGISYLSTEPFNAYLMAKLKIKFNGRYIGARFLCSTIIAAGLDSVIFCSIAFSTLMTTPQLITFILTMWGFKIMIETLGLPVSVFLARRLKEIEQCDRYDTHTSFNIFSFDTRYNETENNYASSVPS